MYILNINNYDAIILAVAHDCFKNLEINSLKKQNSIVYDVKNYIINSIATKVLTNINTDEDGNYKPLYERNKY